MKRRMFALLLALMLAASCCWTGFSEETEAQGQALETEENGENVDSYFSKAVAYFDRLSWKPRFDENWSAWQKVNVAGINDS